MEGNKGVHSESLMHFSSSSTSGSPFGGNVCKSKDLSPQICNRTTDWNGERNASSLFSKRGIWGTSRNVQRTFATLGQGGQWLAIARRARASAPEPAGWQGYVSSPRIVHLITTLQLSGVQLKSFTALSWLLGPHYCAVLTTGPRGGS